MATLQDDELHTELQELYLTGKLWLSDMDFLNGEQKFLSQLIGQQDMPGNTPGKATLLNELHLTQEKQRQLYLNISSFMGQLENMVCDDAPQPDLQLVECFNTLKTEVAEALNSVKALKYRIISR